MARSAALNPASMPFLPGGARLDEEEDTTFGYRLQASREQDRTSTSSLSISPSEYRSVRSSPSPEQDGEQDSRFQRSESRGDSHYSGSPALRQLEADRFYPGVETHFARETSMAGHLETVLDEDLHTPGLRNLGAQAPDRDAIRVSPNPPTAASCEREHRATPPIPTNHSQNQRASSANFPFFSSSPVSSAGSVSQFTSVLDISMSFEAQLKASPIIHNMLERLARCEMSSRDIQRELGDVHRKVNLLVERTSGSQGQPQFKDPFASSNATTPNASVSPTLGYMSGNVAPHQTPPMDDITQISQRLNTLTSSVGQLLALQTQQRQSLSSGFVNGQGFSSSPPQQGDITSNQLNATVAAPTAAILGHGLPSRPDLRSAPRTPNPPMRTWSAGSLDLPVRPSDAGLSRPDVLLRDKRRSIAGGLLRRDSSGILDPAGDNWGGNLSRDNSPMVSKWEHLALSPDLLRSLGKFGVGPPNKIQQRALPFLLRGSDIIAQAPPTQERIAAYVIPAIHIALTNIVGRAPNRGPIVVMISTTVDQATQAQRMIRDLGGPIGVRSALGVGSTSANNDLTQEIRLLQQNMPHILCGTPQKLHALFTTSGGLVGGEVRFLVLDEVDQLIARNLHEFVFNIVKLLPAPRSRPLGAPNANTTSGSQSSFSFDSTDPMSSLTPAFPNTTRRLPGTAPSSNTDSMNGAAHAIERQTALFSNTVPQDVLNLASAIQLREPVRVLVRRDGNVTHADTSQGARGLRQFYLYLAFTAGARMDPSPTPGSGHGIIGSGRGASSAETAQAREWKLDALADLFDDIEVTQAIVHVGGMTALDSVVYKLASRGLEAVPLHGDMNAGTKLAALNKFRGSGSVMMRQPVTKVLVVYDVQVKAPDVFQIPLIINYDLPKAVEEYAHRVTPAISSNYSRAGVVINFVTATGGDVEMLRSIECFYKIKCPEVPMSLRDIV